MGKALFGLWLAQKGSAETSVPLTESSRSHEDVPSSKLSQHTVVTDSGQSHRSNAATLFAVRISSKLAGRDRRPKVGRDGLCGSGKYADRKSTRLNSSHLGISYAVFCLK